MEPKNHAFQKERHLPTLDFHGSILVLGGVFIESIFIYIINTFQGQRTQALNFKVHQTCTVTKKTTVLNLKVHQTFTGKKTNKTKTLQSTWEGASIPGKCLFLFLFVPVQVWCTLKLKLCVFLCLWRFGAAHLLQHFYLICAFEIDK